MGRGLVGRGLLGQGLVGQGLVGQDLVGQGLAGHTTHGLTTTRDDGNVSRVVKTTRCGYEYSGQCYHFVAPGQLPGSGDDGDGFTPQTPAPSTLGR